MSNVIPLRTQNASPTEWPACETIEEAFLVAALAFSGLVAEIERRAALEGLFVQKPSDLPPLPQMRLGGQAMSLDQVFHAGSTIKKPLPATGAALFLLWRKLMRNDGLPAIATYSEAADFLLKSSQFLKTMEAEDAPA